jgi:hypothetical protein
MQLFFVMMNTLKLCIVFFWICFVSLASGNTIRRTINIPALGHNTLESTASGDMYISYDCVSMNNSPFTVYVTDRDNYLRWQAKTTENLAYYLALSSPSPAMRQQQLQTRVKMDSSIVFVFMTSNLIESAEVNITINVDPITITDYLPGLIIISLAGLGVLAGILFLIRCLCLRKRKPVSYAPVAQQEVAIPMAQVTPFV